MSLLPTIMLSNFPLALSTLLILFFPVNLSYHCSVVGQTAATFIFPFPPFPSRDFLGTRSPFSFETRSEFLVLLRQPRKSLDSWVPSFLYTCLAFVLESDIW